MLGGRNRLAVCFEGIAQLFQQSSNAGMTHQKTDTGAPWRKMLRKL
ncbi:MAG: hypothetical protein F6K26_27830 [Moorea sp. SIO2I5]|nr:hypothetical protein [Moorena sp. SIO2I5]